MLDLTTDKIVFRLPGKNLGLPSFSADGKFLLASSADQWIVWKPGTWEQVFAVPREKEGSYRATLSPDGKMIATTGSGGAISLRNLATGQERFPGRPPVTDLFEIVWASPTALVSRPALFPSSVTRWDGNTGRWLGKGPNLPLWSHEAVLHPQGKLLAFINGDSLGIWNLPSGKEKRNLNQGNKEWFRRPMFSPDGTHIAALGFVESDGEWVNPTLRLWRVNSGKEVRSLTLPKNLYRNLVMGLVLSPDNQTVLVHCAVLEKGVSAWHSDWYFWNSAHGQLCAVCWFLTYMSSTRLFHRDGRWLPSAATNWFDYGLERGRRVQGLACL